VVGGEQIETVREKVFGPVGETVVRLASDNTGLQEKSHISVEGYLAETDDDTYARQSLNLMGEVGSAVANLLRERLVAGRGTADHRGDPCMTKLETVVAGYGARFAGEAELVKDRVHEIAGAVARKGAPGAVGSVSAWGEAEDQNAGAMVAEAGNGTRPVGLVKVGTPFGLSNAAAVVAKSRATFAGDDGFANLLQERERSLCVGRRHFPMIVRGRRHGRLARQTTE